MPFLQTIPTGTSDRFQRLSFAWVCLCFIYGRVTSSIMYKAPSQVKFVAAGNPPLRAAHAIKDTKFMVCELSRYQFITQHKRQRGKARYHTFRLLDPHLHSIDSGHCCRSLRFLFNGNAEKSMWKWGRGSNRMGGRMGS